MTITSLAQKATFLNLLRVKLSKIGRAERRYIDRAEENVRAYDEALADANVITDDERDDVYEQAKRAAEDAVQAFRTSEEAELCDEQMAFYSADKTKTSSAALAAANGLGLSQGSVNSFTSPYKSYDLYKLLDVYVNDPKKRLEIHRIIGVRTEPAKSA